MKTPWTFAGLTIVAFTSYSAGSVPVGRGEISFDVSASATYDTNVNGVRNGSDDYYGTFSPRVNYARRAGRLEADANLGFSSHRYLDQTQFDSDDIQANVGIKLSEKSYPNISGSFGANYSESFVVDNDVNARIKSKTVAANAQLGLVTGPRTKVGSHASYSKALRSGASDQDMLTAGLNFDYSGFLDSTTLNLIYDFSESGSSGDNLLGVDLDQSSHLVSAALSRQIYQDVNGRVSYGYRILNRSSAETSTGSSRESGAVITASVEGPFLPPRLFPKIKSHFSLGYQDAATPGINDSGSKEITGSLGLTWLARQNTTISVDASRSQRLSVSDLTVISSTVRLQIEQVLRYNLSGSLGTSYNWESYRGFVRSDEIFSVDASLRYSFARSWRAEASYRYQDTKSSSVVSAYKHATITVSLGYRF